MTKSLIPTPRCLAGYGPNQPRYTAKTVDLDSAKADTTFSANVFLQYCKYSLVDNPRGGFNVGWPTGVCFGTVTVIVFVARLLPEHLRSCKPEGVTNEQAVRVVIAYVEARPERMHEDMRSLAIEAFHHAWPC
jgi:hypothetical protein